MKRILSVVALTAAMVLAVSATGDAARLAPKKHPSVTTRVAGNAVCPISDPSPCSGPCTRCPTAAASTKSVSAAGAKANARACPVSDPSACPASCRSNGAVTVAANVDRH
jgi:hypothetical protein